MSFYFVSDFLKKCTYEKQSLWNKQIININIAFRYLVKERQRLQDARERVHEQRRFLAKSSSPSGKKKHRHDFDVLAFLKGLGLYHPVKPRTPTPPRRKTKRKVYYCPMYLPYSYWIGWWLFSDVHNFTYLSCFASKITLLILFNMPVIRFSPNQWHMCGILLVE